MSSSSCSLVSDDSASGWGWGPTFQRAVRMGMACFLYLRGRREGLVEHGFEYAAVLGLRE